MSKKNKDIGSKTKRGKNIKITIIINKKKSQTSIQQSKHNNKNTANPTLHRN